MPRLSANLGFLFADRPLAARVVAARAVGFRAVEFHAQYEMAAAELRGVLDREGVVPLSFNTPPGPGGEFGLAGIPGCEIAFAEAVERAASYVATVGGLALHCIAGAVVGADNRRPHLDVMVSNLAQCAAVAARYGINLWIEMINQRDRPGYLLHTVEEAAMVIRETGQSNVKMIFDTYHVQIMQGDVIRRIENTLDVIGHVQIAAVPDRGEPDQGELDHAFLMTVLDRLGYTGWVGAEYRPRTGCTEDGLGWIARLAEREAAIL